MVTAYHHSLTLIELITEIHNIIVENNGAAVSAPKIFPWNEDGESGDKEG